jgi:uncharacterized protein (DUF305 family)
MHARNVLAALGAAAALAATGCGGEDRAGSGAEAPGTGTDRAFVAAMIPHHEGALAMARIAQQRGRSDVVRRLADDIADTQAQEISTLRREDEALAEAGVQPGALGVPEHATGTHGDTAQLRGAEPFDRAFIEMMIPHHAEAIAMARAERARGKDPELRALAQAIIAAQEREIRAMREHLAAQGDDAAAKAGAHGSSHPG